MKYRIKRFSASGQFMAGAKEGLKGLGKGAMWGGVLAPGNLFAAATGHKKTALGLTAAGAAIGGTIGARLGWKNGVHKYKLENDPEYAEKIKQEEIEFFKKVVKAMEKEDAKLLRTAGTYGDWAKIKIKLKEKSDIELPTDFLNYVKFYDSWKSKARDWYRNSEYVGEQTPTAFCDAFPCPLNLKDLEAASDHLLNQLALLYYNNPDIAIFFDYKEKEYTNGWDDGEKTLKKLLIDQTKSLIENTTLTDTQVKIIKEYISKLQSL